jgi:ferrochelatase
MKTRRGLILLNLGGPGRLEDVSPFLYNLFSDPDILVGVPAPLRQALAFTISRVKGRSSRDMYRLIGGGSPQLSWTTEQARGLAAELGDAWRVEIGMRAWNPTIAEALARLKDWGAEELVALPLFPQYSTTTTGSCFKEIRRVLARLGWQPPLREIAAWPEEPGYVELLRETLDDELAGTDAQHVLFSAHSLPMKIIERGDPYPQDVARTVTAVARDLKLPWSVAFQSRNGKLPWLEPYVEDELERLARAGVRRLVVVPVSFVSDHIETLYELDILYAGRARELGIESYHRARVFNGDARFARVLAGLVS